MTPDPATESFELAITITPEDIDELGHVNNVVYLRWVQETAVAHWRAAATPAQQAEVVWVVVRHEIEYKPLQSLMTGLLQERGWGPRRRRRLNGIPRSSVRTIGGFRPLRARCGVPSTSVPAGRFVSDPTSARGFLFQRPAYAQEIP